MRLNGDALDDLVTLVEGQPAPIVALSDPVRTFIVTSYLDAPDKTPGDGVCKPAEGGCTLRAAIQEANASAGDDPRR